MNMVSGLSVPTAGKVRVLGYEIPRDARRVRQILGTVPQETALYEELSCAGYLWHPSARMGL